MVNCAFILYSLSTKYIKQYQRKSRAFWANDNHQGYLLIWLLLCWLRIRLGTDQFAYFDTSFNPLFY